ncbi:porin [Vibrio sp. JC009]|uniref:porin n=1 Tax=Vibrio sp. JC009 TaxID=2912314 RepID=UPI0023AFF943|nr:porin [Vibrio sp. JC009]WED22423.1 porin [Vibrio sp. JC009]
MNKKIIALAVAFAATGVNAATIYENNATTVGLSGGIDAFLSDTELKNYSATDDYTGDADVDVSVKIQIDANHQLNDDVMVFGSFEIEDGTGFKPGGEDKNVTTDDEYIGAMFGDNFGIAVGEIGDFGDSLDAITIDNTNEGYGYMDDFVTSFESAGNGISLKYSTDALTLIADTFLSEEEDQDAAYGVSAEYTAAGFTAGASYQDHGNRGSSTTTNSGDNDVYGVKLGYAIAGFSVNANYAVEQINSVDIDVIGASADYTVDAARLYVSAFQAEKDGFSDEMTAYTVGADYAFSDALKGFIEYSSADNYKYDNDAEETIAVAGVYFSF